VRTGDLHLFEKRTNVHYVLHLRPDGSTETAEVANEAPNFFSGPSAFGGLPANVGRPGVTGRLVRVPVDLLPVIGTSMGLIDYVIRLHNPTLGETVAIRVVNIRNGIPGRVTIKRLTRWREIRGERRYQAAIPKIGSSSNSTLLGLTWS
jgi:hypothetical protein